MAKTRYMVGIPISLVIIGLFLFFFKCPVSFVYLKKFEHRDHIRLEKSEKIIAAGWLLQYKKDQAPNAFRTEYPTGNIEEWSARGQNFMVIELPIKQIVTDNREFIASEILLDSSDLLIPKKYVVMKISYSSFLGEFLWRNIKNDFSS
jgi:hypothetical protein